MAALREGLWLRSPQHAIACGLTQVAQTAAEAMRRRTAETAFRAALTSEAGFAARDAMTTPIITKEPTP